MLDARGGASKAEGFSGRAGCLPGGWGTGESRKMVLGGKGKERNEVDRGGKGGENRGRSSRSRVARGPRELLR